MAFLNINWSSLFRRKSVKYAIPFLLMIVGGSFGLKEFTTLRYEFRKVHPVKEEAKKLGIPMQKPEDITLEKEFEKVKAMDLDDWEQVRGPRPWEENVE